MVTPTTEQPSRNLNISGDPQRRSEATADHGGVSDYELSREERIKENRERMQKLGIFDLSVKLKELNPAKRKTPHRCSPLPAPSGPVRRSSRLQNSTPVSYCEVKTEKPLKDDDDFRREVGSKPEVYTEEHEKLLGSTEMSWTLFVDGYGKDGKRIYDPVKGKTCHQCRQKTLGHRTHCSQCNMVQGQFCGDCLYMRYGENVLEANVNPNWICPVCRGICNCSLCRQAKGWPPTGTLYRKISSLGYKSVAHYLIQTRHAKTDSDESVGTKVPTSAKRSLPFSGIEVTAGDDGLSKPSIESLHAVLLNEFDKKFGESKMTPENGSEPLVKPDVATDSNDQVEYPLKLEFERNGDGFNNDKEANLLADSVGELKTSTEALNDTLIVESTNDHVDLIPETTLERGGDDEIKKEEDFVVQKSTKKRVISEPTTPDSIARRLRSRHNKPETSEEVRLIVESRNDHVDLIPETPEKGGNDEVKKVEEFVVPKSTKKCVISAPTTPDSIARRLRSRHNKTEISEEVRFINADHTTVTAEDTSVIAEVDSVASRLRIRRRA